MLERIFGKRRATTSETRRSAKGARRRRFARPEIDFPDPAPDRPLIVIGDIHGAAGLLAEAVDAALEARAADGAEIVLVGDYVDRGERVAETLEILAALDRLGDDRPIMLKGNHEAMLLAFLEAPAREARWLRTGGLSTLMSFGIMGYETTSAPELVRIRDELEDALSPYLGLLTGLPAAHRSGTVFCSHAGADPLIPLDRQDEAALMWGGREFEKVPRRDGQWVVHGHRVVDAPRIERGRIAIDTGAYFSGCLTSARIDPDGAVRFTSHLGRRG